MKESANIALSWVKQYALKHALVDEKWFENKHIHLHVPEGATPKDGPSAGITMAIALLSLIKNKPIKKNIAMTGELSLTGQVLAIGGLREKTVAAIRNQIKQIIIPQSNLRDLDEIPEIVKNKVVFSPVRSFEEVIELLF
jgi:ATP-dependent Lon protease